MSLTIYKASAGSGKTFTLSATYIAHLLSGESDKPYRHQLAITFTNKATAEMKDRILQYLYSLANGMPATDEFFQTVKREMKVKVTDDEIRDRAGRALRGIIHDYDQFHVTTIDSFFQSLLSTLAHELNLSSSFKVEIGDGEVLAKAVKRLLTNLQEGTDELRWITQYIEDRISEDLGWNMTEELMTLAKQITKEHYMLNSHLLNRSEHPEEPSAVDLTNEVVNGYKSLLNKVIRQHRQLLTEKAAAVNDAIESGLTYANISNGKGHIKPFVTNAANARLSFKKLGAPSDSFRKYAAGEKNLLTVPNQKKPELVSEADAIVPLLEDLVNQYDNSKWTVNSCLLSLANLNPLRLLDTIDKEVRNINKENDRMLLAYTPLLFHQLAKDTDASFVFERAGTQYQHIMIDEFQDTSKLQWSNIKKLLVENMAAGNSCMLVGDVKQGIYRFRGGDWNALAGFREEKSGEGDSYINIKKLETNFRSGEVVVEFNNRLFTTAPGIVSQYIRNAWQDDPEGKLQKTAIRDESLLDIERIYPVPADENDFEVVQRAHNKGGFVRVEFVNLHAEDDKKKGKTKDSDEAVAEAADDEKLCLEASVAEQMVRLNDAGVPYRDMAILVRGNKDAQPLLKYFEEHHNRESEHPIELMSEEAFLLSSSPAVVTIINALRYVANTRDAIALEYLHSQCPADRSMDEIKEQLNSWSTNRYNGLPFYELSLRIAELFGLNCQPRQSPYLYSFLDSVLAYIDDHSSDIKEFLQYWDETLSRKAIPSAAVEGVRILTIHKSKGLAFHSVFIPYCDWKVDQGTDFIWTRPTEAPYNTLPVLPIKMTADAGQSIYRDIFKQEMFDKYVENLNLLYVAFTRTKQNLLVWADCKKKGIAPILRDAIAPESECTEWGTPSALYVSKPSVQTEADTQQPEATEKSANPLEYTSRPIYINFEQMSTKLELRQSRCAKSFLAPEEPDENADEETRMLQESYRQTGILLHNLMQNIDKADEVDAQIDEAARLGQLPLSLSKEQVRKLICRRISHPTARQWFDGSWQLYRECSIIYREGGEMVTKRPDRVMSRGNVADGTDETIVIDFKFGKYQAEHREQVQKYMELLQRQGRHHVQGYLWYLYTGAIEPVLL